MASRMALHTHQQQNVVAALLHSMVLEHATVMHAWVVFQPYASTRCQVHCFAAKAQIAYA